MNLMLLLEMAAQGLGDRVAVCNGSERLTYQQLFDAAKGAAAQVRASGAAHLAVLDVSSLAVPVGLFASSWAGVPFVPLNYRLTAEELRALMERVSPLLLVTDPERASRLGGGTTTVLERGTFLERAHTTAGGPAEWSMDPEDIAVLLFTSGTTGVPKAAVLRQRHLTSYILGSVEFMGAGEDQATLVSVPPYHVAGVAAILSSVYSGRRIVQLPSFDAQTWLDTARREAVTHAFVVPTMMARIVDALEGQGHAGLPALRAISYGGGRMPQPVIERAMRLFPETDFTNAYGLTETSSTISVLGPDDHRTAADSDDPAVRRRLFSVGRPLPGIELQVRGEDGAPLGPNQRGEIYVRGEQVSGEYLGRAAVTEADGWFPTRDGGMVDEAGFVFLEGRVDDVIVRGGENMSPGEIEDVLLEHQAVADCAVVGVPDVKWGEAVAAAVVVKPGASVTPDELRDWVTSHLRSSRAPQHIVFRKELPYSETGKLLRRVVRAELSELAS